MENMERAKSMLMEMAVNIGMDNLEMDSEGYCAIVTENEDVIHIKYVHEENSLIVLANVGDFPNAEIAEEILTALLTANFLWLGTMGSTLALEPEGKGVILQQKIDLQDLNAEDLGLLIMDFVNYFIAWKSQYQNALTSLDE